MFEQCGWKPPTRSCNMCQIVVAVVAVFVAVVDDDVVVSDLTT